MPVVTPKARQLEPHGTYPARLKEVEERTSERTEGTYYRWLFEARRKDGTTFTISATSSTKFTPRSKAWAWAEALGRTITLDEAFELNDLGGRECLLDVRVEVKNGEEFNTVASVLPPP